MENYSNNQKYLDAKNHVKKVKGFYIHALVYTLVNLFIIFDNILDDHHSIGDMDNYWTAIFWGIALIMHGLTVFMPNFILGKDWEDRKIKELMNNHRN